MRTKSGPAARPPDGKRIWQRLYDTAYRLLVPFVGERWATIILVSVVFIAPALVLVLSRITSVEPDLKSLGYFMRAEYYRVAPIGRAEAGRFTVVVAQLDNDADDKMEKLILADLQDIRWIRLLQIHRALSLNDTDRQKSILDGHATALKFLKESGAQILVWGTVLDDGNRKIPELFISSAPDPASGLKHGRYQLDEVLNLPPIFWQQLASVLDLVIASESLRFLANQNPHVGDALKPFITKVEQLLADTQEDPRWNGKTRIDVENALAQALWAEADVSNTTGPLAEAVDIFERIVKTCDPQKDWKQLAAAEQTLGIARLALARRETRFGVLAPTAEQQALFKRAIDDLNGSTSILMRHGELAAPEALLDLGNFVSAAAGLGAQQKAWGGVDAAVSAYRESAVMSPQERNKNGTRYLFFGLVNWAVIIAANQGNVKNLHDLVAWYRELLLTWTMEKYPSLSIMATGALVDALLLSAPLESGQEAGASLSEAVEKSRKVIRDRQILGETPTQLDWTRVAEALSAIGARDPGPGGTDRLREAIRIYRNTLYPYVPVRASADWFRVQWLMAWSLQSLAERQRSPAMLCDAFTRSIAAEKGLAATGASFEQIVGARNQAENSIRSLRTGFGDQAVRACQVAQQKFLKVFGPH